MVEKYYICEKICFMEKEDFAKLLVEKSKKLIGKLDGDDIYELYNIIDRMYSENLEYNDLINDLNKIAYIMWYEFGLNYGNTLQWKDESIINIINLFENQIYTRTEENLDKLISAIINEINEHYF